MAELLDSLGIRNRASVEAFVQALIDMLDDMEPDCDLEPSLGWSVDGEYGTEFPAVFGTDLEGDDSDLEPEETDQNGDEGDYLSNEDDCPEHLWGVPVVSLPSQGL